jgi:tripartite-type tricarboxylate transporter receptor subunit TctC
MKILRREFLQLAAGTALLPAATRAVLGQAYPARPVRLMVGFAAGQAIDILARLVGQWLSDRLGQQFVVENRPGAGGNIAAEAVVRAPADGYTLLVIGANNAINATLYDNLAFNVIRDVVPVAGIYRVPQVMEVNPAFPANTVSEFIAHAKANPRTLNFASAGVGSVAHVSGELFKMLAGVDMQHIPYRGAPPALADLIAGHVHVMFDNMPSSIEHIRTGRLRALGVSTPRRLDVLPDVPTIGEFVPGFETMAFAGLGAPKDTPEEIVRILNHEVNAGLVDATLRGRILDLGGIPLPVSPAEFGKLLADETEKWMKVVKFSGAKAS